MIHILIGILGAVLIVLMLVEFFVTFLLPRRVKRDPAIARGLYRLLWRPWRAVARRLSPRGGDTWLGFFGPLGLVLVVALWTVGLIVGFAAMQWAFGSDLDVRTPVNFGHDLYFSAGTFFSASTGLGPQDAASEMLEIAEAASGFAVLFVVIGYLPALFQAFSRREVAVSQLGPIAGAPPTAGRLLQHSAERSRWNELDEYLQEWETWAAELMETHLSYPILAYFRSQHVNQSWLGALITVVDTCAARIAAADEGEAVAAELTLAIGQHALADLSYVFVGKPAQSDRDRLGEEQFKALRTLMIRCGAPRGDEAQIRDKLTELRGSYEHYAQALSDYLALPLPEWLPPAPA